MKRVGFTFKVQEKWIEEYKKCHHVVWPAMLEALSRHGWRNYSLFMQSDGQVFGYFETPDSFQDAWGRHGHGGRQHKVAGFDIGIPGAHRSGQSRTEHDRAGRGFSPRLMSSRISIDPLSAFLFFGICFFYHPKPQDIIACVGDMCARIGSEIPTQRLVAVRENRADRARDQRRRRA